MKQLWVFIGVWLMPWPLFAAELNAQAFWYEELEQDLPPSLQRYLVTDHFLRIDSGQAGDDYILFDAARKIIYSINHDDQTILTIASKPWQLPEFEFQRHQVTDKLQQGPKLFGQTVTNYRLFADRDMCTEIQLVPEIHPRSRAMFRDYQQVLSGQQVQSLFNTPEDMRSPCFLIDQVFNTGEYYDQGLPVQEWHSRGYVRLLKDVKPLKVDETLFSLPENYQEYSPLQGKIKE
ncbi:MAG: hypothetical protein ACN4GM_00860 [Gammaproteobacteria bacterium]